MNNISFIIPNRGGKDLDKVIFNINNVYNNYEKEIIIVEQSDDKPFMRGQLFNIGVKYSKYDYYVLTDNDIWHLRELPFFDIYDTVKCPLVCFKYITQLTYNNGNIKENKTELRPFGFGACTFLSKEDFYSVNGFSNLFVGWGCEDNIFIHRFNKFIRVPQNLGHLEHPRRLNVNRYNSNLNQKIFDENLKTHFINFKEDGIIQTKFNEIEKNIHSNIITVKVNDITVNENYKYQKYLNKHYEICNNTL